MTMKSNVLPKRMTAHLCRFAAYGVYVKRLDTVGPLYFDSIPI